MSKSWLVTGGAGYIGAHVVRAFREVGLDAVVVDDLSSGHREFVRADVPFVEGSIVDTDLVTQTMEKYAVEGVVVGRPLLGAGPGVAARSLVVLLVVLAVATGRPAHSRLAQKVAKSGKVLPVVAMFSTRTPSTAAPTITPAWAIRWSA